MYIILDCGLPANEHGYPRVKGLGWTSTSFSTWRKAVEYARQWLGEWNSLPNNLENKEKRYFKYNYSGYGDCIEIKEI